MLSVFVGNWVLPAALVGGSFYALAAVQHLTKCGKNLMEQWATVSAVLIAVVLLGFVALNELRLHAIR